MAPKNKLSTPPGNELLRRRGDHDYQFLLWSPDYVAKEFENKLGVGIESESEVTTIGRDVEVGEDGNQIAEQ